MVPLMEQAAIRSTPDQVPRNHDRHAGTEPIILIRVNVGLSRPTGISAVLHWFLIVLPANSEV